MDWSSRKPVAQLGMAMMTLQRIWCKYNIRTLHLETHMDDPDFEVERGAPKRWIAGTGCLGARLIVSRVILLKKT